MGKLLNDGGVPIQQHATYTSRVSVRGGLRKCTFARVCSIDMYVQSDTVPLKHAVILKQCRGNAQRINISEIPQTGRDVRHVHGRPAGAARRLNTSA